MLWRMDEAEKELAFRHECALRIIADPCAHQICEGCGSIVLREATICPRCKSYRFERSPRAIVSRAAYLGSRPAITPKYDL